MGLPKLLDRLKKNQGFTLVEALVAISIFIVVIAMATGIFTDSFANKRKTELSRMLYEETRIVFERIVKEMRKGTIDYEEYFSWNNCDGGVICDCEFNNLDGTNDDYGRNYGEYARQFYRDSDGNVPETVTRFHENVGENDLGSDPSVGGYPAINAYSQDELYLITADGTEKTIIKLKDELGENRLEMMKLPGRDSDGDGQIDEWIIVGEGGADDPSHSSFFDFCNDYNFANKICEDDGYIFQKIQPDSIQIISLKFYISPLEDSRKAFAEFTDAVQQHPHVTIVLTAEPSESYIRGIRGDSPTVTLQTTVGARAQNEVISL